MSILALNKLSLAYLERPVLVDCSLTLAEKAKPDWWAPTALAKPVFFGLYPVSWSRRAERLSYPKV